MAIKKNKLIFTLLLCLQFLVSIIKSDEDLVKNSKVLSCVTLARQAVKHERETIEIMIDGLGGENRSEMSSKLLTLLIVKCYRTITKEKAIAILSEMNSRKDSRDLVWNEEFRSILGMNGELTEGIESDEFMQDFKEVNRILRELNDEAKNLKADRDSNNQKESQSSQSQKTSKPSQSDQSSRKKEKEKSIIENIFKPFAGVFSAIISLIGFDSLFGISMTILLIFLLSYSLKKLFVGDRQLVRKKKNPAAGKTANETTQTPASDSKKSQ